MRGRPPPVEQTGGGEHEGAQAQTDDDNTAIVGRTQQVERRLRRRLARITPGRDDDDLGVEDGREGVRRRRAGCRRSSSPGARPRPEGPRTRARRMRCGRRRTRSTAPSSRTAASRRTGRTATRRNGARFGSARHRSNLPGTSRWGWLESIGMMASSHIPRSRRRDATICVMEHIELTPTGGPTLVIDIGGLRLLVDPTFDPPGEYPIGARALVKTGNASTGAARSARSTPCSCRTTSTPTTSTTPVAASC